MDSTEISRNTLSFIGLATEYCAALEAAPQTEKEEFVATMLRLLPRIYITVGDLELPASIEEYEPLATYLDADRYDQIRGGVAAVMGGDDTYLDTFEQDMKYSETPIGCSISESLADIYQPLINCALAVRDSDGGLASEATARCKEEFEEYWGQTLCNVLRPLHSLFYEGQCAESCI